MIGSAVIRLFLTTTICAWLLSCASTASSERENCVGEATDNVHFREAVCEADQLLAEAQYEQAARAYVEAMNMPVHEALTFDLYAKASIAYLKSGDYRSGKEYAERYKVALALFTGIFDCASLDGEFYLVDKYANRVQGAYVSEIARSLCVGEHEVHLLRDNIGRLDMEVDLFQLYATMRNLIEVGQ